MNVFISWSGDLSRKIAEVLGRKIPCIIQSATVFVSSSDIEKGENWDSRLIAELAEARFGIVCLTPDNVDAPWVHFEAGAISQTLDSKVSALMINLNPSDLQGPLKRFQATKIEENDFLSLLKSINDSLELPINKDVLEASFEMAWPSLHAEMETAIGQHPKKDGRKTTKSEPPNTAAIEEILELARKQYTVLTSPEQLLPMSYMRDVITYSDNRNRRVGSVKVVVKILGEIIDWLDSVAVRLSQIGGHVNPYDYFHIELFISQLRSNYTDMPPIYRDEIDMRLIRLEKMFDKPGIPRRIKQIEMDMEREAP